MASVESGIRLRARAVVAAAAAAGLAGAFAFDVGPEPAKGWTVVQSGSVRQAGERVTLRVFPAVHGRIQPVTLLGSIDSPRAGEPIVLEGKECGQTSFKVMDGAHTGPGGGWTLQWAPVITTTLRARWNAATSAPVTVQERVWVQLRSRPRMAQGYGFGVAVRSKLQFWKRFVLVQRFERRRGRWTDVKKVVLTDTGAAPGSTFVWSGAEFRVRVPKGTLVRAVFPLSQARPCYVAGFSNQLRT